MKFDDFEREVFGWAVDRGIYQHSTTQAQVLKAVAEMGELADAVIAGDLMEIKDAMGDIMVCMVNVAAMENLALQDCMGHSWDQIKDRKGHMVPGGAFIKEEDER